MFWIMFISVLVSNPLEKLIDCYLKVYIFIELISVYIDFCRFIFSFLGG